MADPSPSPAPAEPPMRPPAEAATPETAAPPAVEPPARPPASYLSLPSPDRSTTPKPLSRSELEEARWANTFGLGSFRAVMMPLLLLVILLWLMIWFVFGY